MVRVGVYTVLKASCQTYQTFRWLKTRV